MLGSSLFSIPSAPSRIRPWSRKNRRSRTLGALNLHEGTPNDELATKPALQLPAAQHRIGTQPIGNRTGRLLRAGNSLFVGADSTTIACAVALAAVRGSP